MSTSFTKSTYGLTRPPPRLLSAAKAPPQSVQMNRELVRTHMFNVADLDAVLARNDVTPFNRSVLEARRAAALASPPSFAPFFAPCAAVHPWHDACLPVPLERFAFVFRWSLPIYGALHFIPMLLFKRGTVLREPARMLLRAGFGTVRSASFFGMCVMIYQSACLPARVGAPGVLTVCASVLLLQALPLDAPHRAPRRAPPRVAAARAARVAARAPPAGGARRARREALVLCRRAPDRAEPVRRGHAPAGRTGDVCAPEGARERVDYGTGEGVRV